MKKATKTIGKKPVVKKSSKRTVTAVDADVMPVEEVPETQVNEVEAQAVDATPAELTPAEEPKPKNAKRPAPLAPSAAKDATPAPKPMSCLDASAAVLADRGVPMRTKDLIDLMASAELWTSNAPTPATTLYSAIPREINTKGAASRFKKTDRGHFALNA